MPRTPSYSRPVHDFYVAPALVGLHMLVAYFWIEATDVLGLLSLSTRRTLYIAGAAASLTIAGLAWQSINHYYSNTNPRRRMRLLKGHQAQRLNDVKMAAVQGSLGAVAGFFLTITLDRNAAPASAWRWLGEALAIFVILRTWRVIWLTRKLMAARNADEADRPSTKAFHIGGPRPRTLDPNRS